MLVLREPGVRMFNVDAFGEPGCAVWQVAPLPAHEPLMRSRVVVKVRTGTTPRPGQEIGAGRPIASSPLKFWL
jgi:hypothetical protein